MPRKPEWARVRADYRDTPEAKEVEFWAATLYLELQLISRREGCRGRMPAKLVTPKVLVSHLRLSAVRDTLTLAPVDIVRDALGELEEAGIIRLTPDGLELVEYSEQWDRDLSTARATKRRELTAGEQPEPTPDDEMAEPGGPPPAVELAEKLPPEPKKKRKTPAERMIEQFGEAAGQLWDHQEILRASAIPKCRPLKLTEARLLRVCKRLADGNTFDDCLTVLEEYAAEARRDPTAARHFNGETNWRPANFDRQLGMSQGGADDSEARDTLGDFIDWFNAKNGRAFQVRDELVTWVGALLAKGYTQRDLRMVAEDRRLEWSDPDSAKHLRPQVLLKPQNFERWIDAARERYGKQNQPKQPEPAIRLFAGNK